MHLRPRGFEGGEHRPLRIVLVGGRCAEVGEDGIAEQAGDRAPVAFDRGNEDVECFPHHRGPRLGVQLFGHGRRAGDVAEEHRDGATLAAGFPQAYHRVGDFVGDLACRFSRLAGCRPYFDLVPAVEAKLGTGRQLGATVGARSLQGCPAGHAEPCAVRVLRAAVAADHVGDTTGTGVSGFVYQYAQAIRTSWNGSRTQLRTVFGSSPT